MWGCQHYLPKQEGEGRKGKSQIRKSQEWYRDENTPLQEENHKLCTQQKVPHIKKKKKSQTEIELPQLKFDAGESWTRSWNDFLTFLET